MERNLFSILDKKTFSILSSRHQDSYLKALFLLRDKAENIGSVGKKDFRNLIASEMTSIMDDEHFVEDDEERDDFDFKSAGDNALRIISRLNKCGWIYIQYDEEDYEEKIILREHSRIMLDAFDKIMDPEKDNHKGANFQIYAQLLTANEKKQATMYHALKQVSAIAEEYRDWLLSKSVNIKGEYLRRILNQNMSAKEIAEEYLNRYTLEISKAILEPLKTYDDPKIYANDIKDLLFTWEFNRFDEILKQAMEAEPNKTRDELEMEVRGFFRRLSDAYYDIPLIIDSITKDDSTYSLKAIAKMQYIATADSSIKGILIKAMNDAKEQSELGRKMAEAIKLDFSLPLSVSFTLRLRKLKSERELSKAKPLISYNPTEKDVLDIINKLRHEHITQDEINEFVDKQLLDKEEKSTSEFTIITERDFILLLLSEAKADSRKSSYYVDFSPFLEHGSIVEVGGHKIPELIYKRKRK